MLIDTCDPVDEKVWSLMRLSHRYYLLFKFSGPRINARQPSEPSPRTPTEIADTGHFQSGLFSTLVYLELSVSLRVCCI